MKLKILPLIGLALLLLLTIQPQNGQPALANNWPELADVWFTANDLQDGSGQGYVITAANLQIARGEVSAVYQSPTLTAPIPFNALVPQWTANMPPATHLHLRIRTRPTAGQWNHWITLHSHADWDLPDDPTYVGEMVGVPATDITHNDYQFEITLHQNTSTTPPSLNQLRLTFIDTSQGPSTDELIARQMQLDTQESSQIVAESYPKPFVISRAVWCDHPSCSYSGVEHYPVTHLIVHHTVSDNTTVDWAAHVRAIWTYHTFTLGWGDIGYNFLVDPNGTLYEGHLGGDDAVGTHAAIANKGTTALALLGTFETTTPSNAMLAAAAELFAWKADQKNIDVYGASAALPDVPWGLPNLMGHRDVYGGTNTQCPGTKCFNLLPLLRNEIASRLGQVSPYLYVDELSSDFVKSQNANWYTADGLCGHNLHGYFTWSTTDPNQSTNWAKWYPDLPADGRYRLEAYVPYCDTGGPETNGARYEIRHATGTSTVTVSQDNRVGLWINLGEFDLLADGSSYIYLSDLTNTDSGRGVWFDALRLLPLDPIPAQATNQTPVNDSWWGQTAVPFQWQTVNAASVTATRLQVATDATFNNIILTKDWQNATTSYSHTFSQSYAQLYWRIRLTTNSGSVYSTPTRFHLDVMPPTSTIALLAYYPATERYVLFWQGTDDLSGIAKYNIEMRTADSTTWQPLLTSTNLTSIQLTSLPSQTIYFRSQAIDAVGNIETTHIGPGDTDSTQVISLTHDIMLPIIKRN